MHMLDEDEEIVARYFLRNSLANRCAPRIFRLVRVLFLAVEHVWRRRTDFTALDKCSFSFLNDPHAIVAKNPINLVVYYALKSHDNDFRFSLTVNRSRRALLLVYASKPYAKSIRGTREPYGIFSFRFAQIFRGRTNE